MSCEMMPCGLIVSGGSCPALAVDGRLPSEHVPQIDALRVVACQVDVEANTGMPMSLQTVTCARTAVADALFTENNVFMPWPLSRSTSKYGRSSVAAGRWRLAVELCVSGSSRGENTAESQAERDDRSSHGHLMAPERMSPGL